LDLRRQIPSAEHARGRDHRRVHLPEVSERTVIGPRVRSGHVERDQLADRHLALNDLMAAVPEDERRPITTAFRGGLVAVPQTS
jgi:hypothetical protein